MEAKVQFFCCCCSENGISSPKKRHAINQYINISSFLIQLEWTPQSSHVISSRSHFSHPGPDVPSSPRASVSTATPWTVCSAAVWVLRRLVVCLERTSAGVAEYERAWRSTYWLAGLLKGGGTERKRKDPKGCWVVLILQIQRKFTTRGVKVTGGRLRPLSCANTKMIVISEYQSNATNERVPAISDDRLYYLPTAAGWPAASFFFAVLYEMRSFYWPHWAAGLLNMLLSIAAYSTLNHWMHVGILLSSETG